MNIEKVESLRLGQMILILKLDHMEKNVSRQTKKACCRDIVKLLFPAVLENRLVNFLLVFFCDLFHFGLNLLR